MIEAMLDGWKNKWGGLPDVDPLPMTSEPSLPPLPAGIESEGWRPVEIQEKSPFRP